MKNKKSSGFTLIEVLVAIAILAIALVCCSDTTESIIQINSNSKSKVTNGAIAQKIMEYYRSKDFSIVLPASIKTSSPQYLYLAFKDNPAITDITMDPLLSNLSTSTSIRITGLSSIENYQKTFSEISTPPSPGTYNRLVKIIFTYNNNMVKIDTIVWDSNNKDASQVEYIMLKEY